LSLNQINKKHKKMKCYKLTDHNGQTKNNTQWGPNVTHKASGTNNNLCSNGWIHFYTDPAIAVLLNPNHADFKNPILWEVETIGEVKHELLKSGSKGLITLHQIALPEYTIVQKVCFAILCAKFVYKDIEWNEWANSYLTGVDRSKAASCAAYAATAYTFADADAAAAIQAAAYAAYAAAYAAAAAADAAADAVAAAANAAAYAAYAAADAADAVADAADAAADAADAAADADAADAANAEINFPRLAKQALTYH
jgi:hypothetical protein